MQPRLISVVNRQGVKDTSLEDEVTPEFSTDKVFPPYTVCRFRQAFGEGKMPFHIPYCLCCGTNGIFRRPRCDSNAQPSD